MAYGAFVGDDGCLVIGIITGLHYDAVYVSMTAIVTGSVLLAIPDGSTASWRPSHTQVRIGKKNKNKIEVLTPTFFAHLGYNYGGATYTSLFSYLFNYSVTRPRA